MRPVICLDSWLRLSVEEVIILKMTIEVNLQFFIIVELWAGLSYRSFYCPSLDVSINLLTLRLNTSINSASITCFGRRFQWFMIRWLQKFLQHSKVDLLLNSLILVPSTLGSFALVKSLSGTMASKPYKILWSSYSHLSQQCRTGLLLFRCKHFISSFLFFNLNF